jgi:hypothetical protein
MAPSAPVQRAAPPPQRAVAAAPPASSAVGPVGPQGPGKFIYKCEYSCVYSNVESFKE